MLIKWSRRVPLKKSTEHIVTGTLSYEIPAMPTGRYSMLAGCSTTLTGCFAGGHTINLFPAGNNKITRPPMDEYLSLLSYPQLENLISRWERAALWYMVSWLASEAHRTARGAP
jgi:hypothetical protein